MRCTTEVVNGIVRVDVPAELTFDRQPATLALDGGSARRLGGDLFRAARKLDDAKPRAPRPGIEEDAAKRRGVHPLDAEKRRRG